MRTGLLVAALAAFVFALVAVPHAKSAGPPLRDFEAYYAAGATARYHGDPYSRDIWRSERLVPGVVRSRDELLPFVGPPYGLPLWSALATRTFRGASIAWAIVLGLSFATLTLGSLALATGRIPVRAAIATIFFAAAFAPITGGIALGQVALVSCAAIVAVPFALRPRRTLAAVLAVLVAGLQPNLAIVLAVRASDARARVALVSAALVALLGSIIELGGPREIAHYALVLRDHAAAERFIAIQTTPGAVAFALGAPAMLANALALGLAAFVVVTLAVQCLRARHDPDARLLLACAAVPLALPFAHGQEYAIAFAPAIVTLVRARGAAWVWAACAALTLGIDWLGLAQHPHDTLGPVALALAGACALAALASERLAWRHAIPFALVGIVAAVHRLAAAHPLPVWPDALPFGFHVADTLPAAVLWNAEQVASGLAARDPVWGTLRALDLIACAVLWIVASRTLARARTRANAS